MGVGDNWLLVVLVENGPGFGAGKMRFRGLSLSVEDLAAEWGTSFASPWRFFEVDQYYSRIW